jgi:hypothetical protein
MPMMLLGPHCFPQPTRTPTRADYGAKKFAGSKGAAKRVIRLAPIDRFSAFLTSFAALTAFAFSFLFLAFALAP